MALADEIIARHRPKKGFEKFDRTVRAGSAPYQPRIHIPTGNVALDYSTFGGIPMNGISQFFGWEGVGKTESAMRAVAEAQRIFPDRVAVWGDSETSFDRAYAVLRFGIDLDRIIILEGLLGEEMAEGISRYADDPEVAIIVLDSIPTLVPQREVERELDESHAQMGALANIVKPLVNRFLMSLGTHMTNKHLGPAVILINQRRDTSAPNGRTIIGFPGGKAPAFAYQMNVLFRKDKEKADSNAFGQREVDESEHQFEIVKTKLGNSQRTGEYSVVRDLDRMPAMGPGTIDDSAALVAFAKIQGIYVGSTKGGYSFAGVADSATYAKGEEAIAALDADKVLKQQVLYRTISALRASHGMNATGWHAGEHVG